VLPCWSHPSLLAVLAQVPQGKACVRGSTAQHLLQCKLHAFGVSWLLSNGLILAVQRQLCSQHDSSSCM
jgi:hypothetical protein